ncbi:MAG: shikimate dehydrogenase [Coriobacteriales bacterium]|nr:shikimate dehydrogenase [Coriobacteriales bacterium]
MLKAGLVGYPIGHSLSPLIHGAAYAALGLDWSYDLYPCEDVASFERMLEKALADAETFVGLNVTTPYKGNAHAACPEHSFFSAATGSANVLILKRNVTEDCSFFSLLGDDTDGRGLTASLERRGNMTLAASSVVLCGTGPVARSTLVALAKARVASVCVASRDVARATERLIKLRDRLEAADLLLGAGVGLCLPAVKVVGYEGIAAELREADVLIDATTLGMKPKDASPVPSKALREGLIVLDVVYGHGETALIRQARKKGAIAIDGLDMLVEQAALTIELWAKERGLALSAPRNLMRRAASSPLDV